MEHIIYWNVDPEIFHWNFLSIRWYGLLFASSFLIGSFLGTWILKRENKPVESLDRFLIYVLIGTVVGARLGECLFYNPQFYFAHPLEIFKIWKGGLASHGAAIGLLTAIFLYSRKTPGQPYLWVLDRASFTIALGCSFIRIGNLFNSEIIGKPTNAAWGFVFQRIDNIPRHPAQLYESFLYFLIFLLLIALYIKIDTRNKPGILIGIFLVTMLPARFLVEFLKVNQVGFESGLTLNMGQMLSIPLFVLGIFILLKYSFFRKPVPKKY